MRLKHRRRLSEEVDGWIDATDSTTMTDEEQWWHKRITSILLNKKGKWGPYQHALYALRFQDFVLKIVPLSVDPHFTACVIFDRAVVYIGEGFLVDDTKCFQLNVIIRHELAHILLRHQIRMMHHIGELPYSKISMSSSLHQLINIIADFEISNKKYTSDDKGIVLNMYLNGKLIGGLVTEMHREEWMKLTIEEMYDKLSEELDRISSDIKAADGDLTDLAFRSDTRLGLGKKDLVTTQGVGATIIYADQKTPSVIWAPIDEYIKKSKQFSKLAPVWQNIIVSVYKETKDLPEDILVELFEKLVSSNAFKPVLIGKTVELNTPEEKYWANQVLKTLLGNSREKPEAVKVKRAVHSKDYIDAYNKIIRACGKISSCSDKDLTELTNGLMSEIGDTE